MPHNPPDHPTPRIVVLSGPSGTGKTTVVRRLIETPGTPIITAVSATTRPPRAGETEGIDYHFLTADEFAARRDAGEFLEYTEVFGTGTWYGTLRSEVERATAAGAWSLLEIDVQGGAAIKRQFPGAVMIFLRADSDAVYETRLRQRGTESDEAIRRRLDRMREELRSADCYDYQVVNDDINRAVAQVRDILQRREAAQDA